MSLVYYIVTCLNTLCHYFNLHTKKTLFIWNIYFYIMAPFVWSDDVIPYNSLIYFIVDLINYKISNNLTKFYIFHHTSCILICLSTIINNIVDTKIFKLTTIQEVSSILMALFYMGYIPKPIYNILFSFSFISFRLFYFNYAIYGLYLSNKDVFSVVAWGAILLSNIINCGIVWKMRLVQKLFGGRAAIEYLRDKQPKTT
jgi:hypothetical protein